MFETILRNRQSIMSIPETVSGESRAMNVTLLTERRKTIIKDIAELTNEYFSANELGAMRNIDASKPSTAELKTNVENYQSTHFFYDVGIPA